MSLELVGDTAIDPETILTLSLDFDVYHQGQGRTPPHAVLVSASPETYRTLLADVRSRTDVPLVVFLRECSLQDRVSAFETGADDVVSEQFDPVEVLARLRALLRRVANAPAEIIRVGDLAIDVARRTVRRGDRDIELSRIELSVLMTLARADGTVVRHSTLMREVWGSQQSLGSLHTYVSYLRAKLEGCGEEPLVRTVRGVGYALRASLKSGNEIDREPISA